MCRVVHHHCHTLKNCIWLCTAPEFTQRQGLSAPIVWLPTVLPGMETEPDQPVYECRMRRIPTSLTTLSLSPQNRNPTQEMFPLTSFALPTQARSCLPTQRVHLTASMAEPSILPGQLPLQNNCLWKQEPEPQRKHRHGQLLSVGNSSCRSLSPRSTWVPAYGLLSAACNSTGSYPSPWESYPKQATAGSPAGQEASSVLQLYSTTWSWTKPEALKSWKYKLTFPLTISPEVIETASFMSHPQDSPSQGLAAQCSLWSSCNKIKKPAV